MTVINAPFCLDMEKVCDGVQDCITDEDERDCGKYPNLLIQSQTFEKSWLGALHKYIVKYGTT